MSKLNSLITIPAFLASASVLLAQSALNRDILSADDFVDLQSRRINGTDRTFFSAIFQAGISPTPRIDYDENGVYAIDWFHFDAGRFRYFNRLDLNLYHAKNQIGLSITDSGGFSRNQDGYSQIFIASSQEFDTHYSRYFSLLSDSQNPDSRVTAHWLFYNHLHFDDSGEDIFGERQRDLTSQFSLADQGFALELEAPAPFAQYFPSARFGLFYRYRKGTDNFYFDGDDGTNQNPGIGTQQNGEDDHFYYARLRYELYRWPHGSNIRIVSKVGQYKKGRNNYSFSKNDLEFEWVTPFQGTSFTLGYSLDCDLDYNYFDFNTNTTGGRYKHGIRAFVTIPLGSKFFK